MSDHPHPGRLDDGQCVSGKRVYYAEKLANRAITEAAKRGELPTMRHYACPHCGWWHLSRKDRTPSALTPECTEPCCFEKRELADAWQMLIELYRVLVLAGAGSSEKRHRYSFSRRQA